MFRLIILRLVIANQLDYHAGFNKGKTYCFWTILVHSLSLGDKSEYFKRNFKSGRNFRWQKISGNFCFVSITLKRHWPCVIKDIWTFANHMAPLRNGLWTWDHYSKCIINHSKIIWTIIKLQLIFLLFFTQKQTRYACLQFHTIFRLQYE